MDSTTKKVSETSLQLAAQTYCYKETEGMLFDEKVATHIARVIQPLLDELEMAWGIIANAYGGDWSLASKASGWEEAATKWRDRWHLLLLAETGKYKELFDQQYPERLK